MFPATFEALAILALAIAPGFLATSAWARAKTWKGPSGDLRTIIQALVISVVIQVVVSPLTLVWIYPKRNHLDQFPERIAVWLLVVVIIVPVVGGLLAGWITDTLSLVAAGDVTGWRRALAKVQPLPVSPSVWDWVFVRNPPNGRFLVFEFKDGSSVAGVFSEGSLALTSPEPQGIFLASEWLLDGHGDITGERPDTKGVLIPDISQLRSMRIL